MQNLAVNWSACSRKFIKFDTVHIVPLAYFSTFTNCKRTTYVLEVVDVSLFTAHDQAPTQVGTVCELFFSILFKLKNVVVPLFM